MTDAQFLDTVFAVAEELKKAPLTTQEKQNILETFNSSIGSDFIRARSAIEKVIQKPLPDGFLMEKASSSLNNLRRLLAQMNSAAEQWGQGKK